MPIKDAPLPLVVAARSDVEVTPRFVRAPATVLDPVPPSATARSVIPVIDPPVIVILEDTCVAILPKPRDNRADTTSARSARLFARTDLGVSGSGLDTTYCFRANNLADLADVVSARLSLGLGNIATQVSSNITITGGSITGITDLAVADGGTGSSTVAGAQTNLGVTSTSDLAATTSGKGASLIGIQDAGNYYSGSTVEEALQAVGSTLGSTGGTATPPSGYTRMAPHIVRASPSGSNTLLSSTSLQSIAGPSGVTGVARVRFTMVVTGVGDQVWFTTYEDSGYLTGADFGKTVIGAGSTGIAYIDLWAPIIAGTMYINVNKVTGTPNVYYCVTEYID